MNFFHRIFLIVPVFYALCANGGSAAISAVSGKVTVDTRVPEIVVQALAKNLVDNSATPVAFPEVYVGSSKSITFTIKNIGTADLKGLTITKDGQNQTEFTITRNPTAPVSGPTGITTFVVRFTPSAPGERTATLHIANNDRNEKPFDIRLSGEGLAVGTERILSLSGNLAFGDVPIDSAKSAELVIENTGNSALTVTGISYPAGFSGNFVGTIPAGGSSTVNVSFNPTIAEAYGGTLTVESNKTSGNNVLEVTGSGTSGPRIMRLSGNLAFGDVPVASNKTLVLTIKNTGDSPLTVTGISYPEGFSGHFAGTIPAGGSNTVNVSFNPTTEKAYGGTLTVKSNKTSGNNVLEVFGLGASVTRIMGLSGNLAFGDIPVASNKTLVLTIKNTGNSPLNVTGISYPAGFSGNFAGTIPAGGSNTVNVSFNPTTAGAYSGTLAVESNKTGGGKVRAVSGTGFNETRIIGLSGSMAFGDVLVPSTKTQVLTIKNTGNSPLKVTGISYPAGFSGNFAGTIPAGGSSTVNVSFNPTTAGAYSGTLAVKSNKTEGRKFRNVTGTGTNETRIIGLSESMAFGDVVVASTNMSILTIYNTGNSPLTVTGISYPAGFSGNFAGTIPAGGLRTVNVFFNPTAAGAYGGTLTVISNKTGGGNVCEISGTGTNVTRIIGLSGNLAFGNVQVPSTKTLVLTIKNTGNSSLTVTGISYPAGFSGNFAGTIPAGGSKAVNVSFSPTTAKAYSGTLAVQSNKTGGGNVLEVSGIGTNITRIIGLSGNLAFGDVQVASTKTLVLTIKNTGNSPLDVDSISYQAMPGAISDPAGFSANLAGIIPAGGSKTVNVSFNPTTAGFYGGTLTVKSNKTGGTSTMEMSGTGTVPPVILDPGFGVEGSVYPGVYNNSHSGRSMAVQSDGKILIVGYQLMRSGTNDFAVARFNSDGSPDTTFNGTGRVTTAIGNGLDIAESVVVQSDGKIVLAGYSFNSSSSTYDFALVRYNVNGGLDTSFNGTGKVTTAVGTGDNSGLAVTVQSDGKIVVVGSADNGRGTSFAIARYNSSGSLDVTFNATGKVITEFGIIDRGLSLALQNDGKLLVSGNSFDDSFSSSFAIARYNVGGSLDVNFNGVGKLKTVLAPGGRDLSNCVAVQNDGKIVVSGYSLDEAGQACFALVRYNSVGNLDTNFNGTGIVKTSVGQGAGIESMVVQPDGKLVVAGSSFVQNDNYFTLARYDSSGKLDSTFNGSGMVTATRGNYERNSADGGISLAIQQDGKILVAGHSAHGFVIMRFQQ